MSESEPAAAPAPFEFSSRLLFTYVMAIVAFVAAARSIYLEILTSALWLVVTARLFFRFGLRGAWALPSAPFAFYWLYLALHRPASVPAGQVFT